MLTQFRAFVVAISIVGSIAIAAPVLAQSSGSESVAKKTWRDSARENRDRIEARKRQRQERLEASQAEYLKAVEIKKTRKVACSNSAKEQNLHLLKRHRFMKKCMARS